jgi:hypothetical protein
MTGNPCHGSGLLGMLLNVSWCCQILQLLFYLQRASAGNLRSVRVPLFEPTTEPWSASTLHTENSLSIEVALLLEVLFESGVVRQEVAIRGHVLQAEGRLPCVRARLRRDRLSSRV